jgi:enoyl-[acyl-carrier protein] reductase II
MDVVLTKNVKIVITAAGNPRLYTALLRQNGVKVLHVISSVRHAQTAVSSSVDGLVAEGIEAAGHDGFDEIPLFSLIPQVVDAVDVPVVAAGGIADARGMVAAMSLGAEGVQLGTRFVAVEENIAHINYKQAILDCGDADTAITCRKIVPARSLKSEFTMRLLELEASGASAEEVREFLGYRRPRKAQIGGDLAEGEAYCGSSGGLVKDIIPAGLVIERLVKGYEEVIKTIV